METKRIMNCSHGKRRFRRVVALVALMAGGGAWGADALPATGGAYDRSMAEFPRAAGETDDTARVQRAIDATTGGILWFPRGDYLVSSSIVVSNRCSLLMHKSATLKAVAEMKWVLRIKNGGVWDNLDFLCFVRGGAVDGNGLASCIALENFWRHSLDDIKILNGRQYGLFVRNGGAEVVAKGLYFLVRKHGLAGNIGMYLEGGDSHYTDIHVLDYTTGVVVRGPANRLTRIHVWGGSLPRRTPDEIPEMLPGSTAFRVEGHSTTLRDCYADTAQTGFDIRGAWEVRLLGCSFFNNVSFGLNDLLVVRQTGNSGALLVADCVFTRSGLNERVRVYEGNGNVKWRDIIYAGNWSGVERPDVNGKTNGKLESPNTKLAGY